MKTLSFCLLLFFGLTASAHITKAEIEKMMSDMGTSPDKITEVYIGNTMTYYKDGTSKQSYTIYNSEKGNKMALTEAGIRIDWKKDGKLGSVFYVPYSSIISFQLGPDYVNIYIRKG